MPYYSNNKSVHCNFGSGTTTHAHYYTTDHEILDLDNNHMNNNNYDIVEDTCTCINMIGLALTPNT